MQSNEVKWLPLKCLQPNTGQVPGLPGNPRQWTDGDVKRIARSLRETPELFVARPIIVLPYSTPGAEDCYVILGGNLRSEGGTTVTSSSAATCAAKGRGATRCRRCPATSCRRRRPWTS